MAEKQLTPQDKFKMIAGAVRLRELGYKDLATAFTLYALGKPMSKQRLMAELCRIGPDHWNELKRFLQSPPYSGPHSPGTIVN